jgi:hypothetical protein
VDKTRKDLGTARHHQQCGEPRREGAFDELSRGDQFEVNLTGPRNICRNVLPLMKGNGPRHQSPDVTIS